MARAGETRRKFIDSAELLFGTKGIDQVRTKELLAAAEQKNESALQYHFGSRAGLIDAIMKDRMQELDLQRQKLISVLEEDGQIEDPNALVRTMLQPIAERVAKSDNGPAFIGLLAQVAALPGASFPDMIERYELIGAKKARDHLLAMAQDLPEGILQQRDRLTLNMAASALKAWTEHRDVSFDEMLNDLIATIVAVFLART